MAPAHCSWVMTMTVRPCSAGGSASSTCFCRSCSPQCAGGLIIAEQDSGFWPARGQQSKTQAAAHRPPSCAGKVVLSPVHLVQQHGMSSGRGRSQRQSSTFPARRFCTIVKSKDKASHHTGSQPLFIKAADLAVQRDRALIAGVHAAQHIRQHGGVLPFSRGAEDDAELTLSISKLTWSDAAIRAFHPSDNIFAHCQKQHKRLRHAEIPP